MIVPHPLANFRRLLNDPRLNDFFQQAASNGSRFVVGYFDRGKTHISGLHLTANNTLFYPQHEYLLEFARRLAKLLSGHSAAIEDFTERSQAQLYC